MNQTLRCITKYTLKPKGKRNPFRNGRAINLKSSCKEIIKERYYNE